MQLLVLFELHALCGWKHYAGADYSGQQFDQLDAKVWQRVEVQPLWEMGPTDEMA